MAEQKIGTADNPLRVAIIGSGPAGFYAAESLLKQKNVVVEVDVFDRLPTPFGLVRAGVAPDHLKIKSVTKAFDRTAKKPNFRFFGNVELGKDINVEDLHQYYHQILYSTGTEGDRMLNIPGEDLNNIHSAREFVAWYNGHPDYKDYEFDLSQEKAAVIGVGNVAVDVARILCRTTEELHKSDMATHAIEALAKSNIKEVYILGRRGIAQAAFTNSEIRELGEMMDADTTIPAAETMLDALSESDVKTKNNKALNKKIEIIQNYADHAGTGKSRLLTLRFLKAMRIVKNELYEKDDGTLRPRATENFEEIPIGLVFRSVGYRGKPLPGVLFKASWGTIPNRKGRIFNEETEEFVLGEYTAGWIKRGPSGVVGTNKADAVETVKCMMEDLTENKILSPSHPDKEAIEMLLKERNVKYISYQDWLKLDEIELAKGKEQGRPRVKFVSIEDVLASVEK